MQPVREENRIERNEEDVPIVNQMKALASNNPEFAADIIKLWVSEEGT